MTRWTVLDANHDPERAVAVADTRDAAERLRDAYLTDHPGTDPSWVYLASDPN